MTASGDRTASTGAMAAEEALAAGRAAVDRHDLESALSHFDRAAAASADLDDSKTHNLARLNRASVMVALGRGREVTAELRARLLAGACDRDRYLAAAALALHYNHESQFPKARFYGQLSLDHAQRCGEPAWIARSHNELGSLHVADSYFDEAAKSYETALAFLPAGPSLDRALVLINLGYCCVVREQHGRAFELLTRGLRMLRHLGSGAWEVQSRVRLCLCLAYLEIERFERARVHGEKALAAAEELEDGEGIKKALYLLGEVEKLDGRRLVAYSHFARLRDDFFPSSIGLPDMLMATDTHKMINLMA